MASPLRVGAVGLQRNLTDQSDLGARHLPRQVSIERCAQRPCRDGVQVGRRQVGLQPADANWLTANSDASNAALLLLILHVGELERCPSLVRAAAHNDIDARPGVREAVQITLCGAASAVGVHLHRPAIGPGLVFRIGKQLQREFLRPPAAHGPAFMSKYR